MAEVVHAETCQFTRVVREAGDFEERYPNFCRRCAATGTTITYESHGFAYGAEALPDICACVDSGRCPLCAGPVKEVALEWYDGFECMAESCVWRDNPEDPFPGAPMLDDAPFWYCTCGAEQPDY